MKKKDSRLVSAVYLILFAVPDVMADQVVGKVIAVEGHLNPACRRVAIREAGTGTERVFRLANPAGGPDSIAAVALTALATQLDISVFYDPAQTTGCGAEPVVISISVSSGN